MKAAPQRIDTGDESRILTLAVTRAADRLEINQKTLAATLGISEASASRLRRGRTIDPDSKEGELAILLVRLFRSLDALVGGSAGQARDWLHAHNHHLGQPPIERIRTVTGLTHVTDYLDAMRG